MGDKFIVAARRRVEVVESRIYSLYVEEFRNREPGQSPIRWTVNRDKAMPFEDTEAAAAVLMIREILDEDYVLRIEPA